MIAFSPESSRRTQPLSILLNGPETFAGRKMGALVTDGGMRN